MNSRIVRACGMAALFVGGAASVASASYVQTFGNPSTYPNDFAIGAQIGPDGPKTQTGNANSIYSFNTGDMQLTGNYGVGDAATVVLTASGATTGDGENAGVYANTDAAINFKLVGTESDIEFGMSNRQNETNEVYDPSQGHDDHNYNTYPDYRVDYVGGASAGTLTLSSDNGYQSNTVLASAPATLGSLGDDYRLELSTQDSGAATSIVATFTDLSNLSILPVVLTDSDPATQIAQGQIGFYGGSTNGNTSGIDVSQFTVNAVATPEPSVIGLVTLAGSGLLLKRRRRAR
jgi:hypothetical protein